MFLHQPLRLVTQNGLTFAPIRLAKRSDFLSLYNTVRLTFKHRIFYIDRHAKLVTD